jgi:hypothetical protein
MPISENIIPANIIIGDRNYRIKIDPKDEQVIRGHVKLINEKILDFKTIFPGKDMQDYVAMALIWFATEKNNTAISVNETDTLLERLQQLDDLIHAELK